jgi:UDP-N-acetylmuramate-alanine ligase
MPLTIAKWARGGDVVLCMGAGSMGQVPARVVQP